MAENTNKMDSRRVLSATMAASSSPPKNATNNRSTSSSETSTLASHNKSARTSPSSAPPKQNQKNKHNKNSKMAFEALLTRAPTKAMTPPPSESDSSTNTGPIAPHHRAGKTTPGNGHGRSSSTPLSTPRHSPDKNHWYGSQPQHSPQNIGARPPPQSRGSGKVQGGQFIPRRPKPPKNPLELRVLVSKIPLAWTTWDLYTYVHPFGNPTRVDMYEARTLDRNAKIVFQPAPRDVSWVGHPVVGEGPDGVARRLETKDISMGTPMVNSINDLKKRYPERMTLPLVAVDFGLMQTESKMQILQSSQENAPQLSDLTLDLSENAMFVSFAVEQLVPDLGTAAVQRHFKMRINLAQMRGIDFVRLADESLSLVFTIDSPPQVFRKTTNIRGTHHDGATLWDERKTWFRQTDIDVNPLARDSPVKLGKESCIVDIGRWLSYRLRLSQSAFASPDFANISQALADHNINLGLDNNISFDFNFFDQPAGLSIGLDCLAEKPAFATPSSLGDLHQMNDSVHLPFNVRYQLEVCMSLGVLHECNIDRMFVEKLAALDSDRAVKVLEKVADTKTRYYEPASIFRFQGQVSVAQKKRPGYCTKNLSAVVTPSTVYFATPVLETSNRVVRQFQQYEDRFLRVKFTDERYKGKIMSSDDLSMNEVFSRTSRTLTHGIVVGNRHYEFLAFGSSQFREHGALFFASTTGCTAADIRQWMGDFTSIKVVAKYCARLGQCFSTTRAIPHTVNIERIPDVEKDGFNFTDGVGKLSPFLARMIANHFRLPNNSDHDCPSVFQFRLAGCKGVLAVDPALKGTTMQIRPSQEKFPAKYQGLEICRIAHFQAANLNMQLILVLSTLGVPDQVFLNKLRNMLSDLSVAMTNEHKACELLQKNIDFNQMTLELASMIYDGFMESQDPFTITCLRLWRSWNLKYIKEKARIFVEGGAFLIGTTDETQTLRGHFNTDKSDSEHPEASQLPEIFLQIPDFENKGKFKVITAICALTRNPALHPGDIRIVRAVDVPALRHHRNTVVLPQTGDRDLSNMCSGGDLDGDDYIVMWEKDLLPREWNHEPMDYTAPAPVESEGPVTVKDIAKFFVQHIKHGNLGRIAVAHRYWADNPGVDDGVKNPRCLDLAELHSKAVDYAKTGVPAEMPAHLRVQQWPHWCEPKNKSQNKIYISRKVLGRLYDEVRREPFEGAWDQPFDRRILDKHEPTEQELQDASEVKSLYDEAVRRIMAQYGIQTEFEVATTFILDHHQEIGDYKFAETIGEIVSALRDEFRETCYTKAGTTSTERNWSKMKPFIIAMYIVTENQVAAALLETNATASRGGRAVSVRPVTFDTMPFISFPWLFARELGIIATDGKGGIRAESTTALSRAKTTGKQKPIPLLGDELALAPLPEVTFAGDTLHEGDVLDLFQDECPAGSSVALQPSKSKPSSSSSSPLLSSSSSASPIPAEGGGTTAIVTATAAATADADVAAPASLAFAAGASDSVQPCVQPYRLPLTAQTKNADSANALDVARLTDLYQAAGLPTNLNTPCECPYPASRSVAAQAAAPPVAVAAKPASGHIEKSGCDGREEDEEEEPEEVELELDAGPTPLEKLARLIGFREE